MKRCVVAAAFVVAVATAFFPASASAKEKMLGRFDAWRAYSYNDGGQTVCYMVTTKISALSAGKRATPYLMITHRPTEASTDVISYSAGALMDERRGANLHIGGASFELFAVRDIAWARDARTDHQITKAIIAASASPMPRVQAKGILLYKGKIRKTVIDTFDVTGAAKAYRAIGKACGLSLGAAPKAKKLVSGNKTPSSLHK